MVVLTGEIVKNKLVVETGDDYIVVDCLRINEYNVHLLIDFFKFAPSVRREGKIIHLRNVSKTLKTTIDRMGLTAEFSIDSVA